MRNDWIDERDFHLYSGPRDEIRGHQINKRLESFALFYSIIFYSILFCSILLMDFKENHTLLWL